MQTMHSCSMHTTAGTDMCTAVKKMSKDGTLSGQQRIQSLHQYIILYLSPQFLKDRVIAESLTVSFH